MPGPSPVPTLLLGSLRYNDMAWPTYGYNPYLKFGGFKVNVPIGPRAVVNGEAEYDEGYDEGYEQGLEDGGGGSEVPTTGQLWPRGNP